VCVRVCVFSVCVLACVCVCVVCGVCVSVVGKSQHVLAMWYSKTALSFDGVEGGEIPREGAGLLLKCACAHVSEFRMLGMNWLVQSVSHSLVLIVMAKALAFMKEAKATHSLSNAQAVVRTWSKDLVILVLHIHAC
jgi:hypothetical protein